MEQRLRSTLPPLAAWAVIGACILFWVLSALGLLRLPASVPSLLTFAWLYLNALAALLSAVAAAAAVAALVLHRRESRRLKRARPASNPTDPDAAEETGLDQLLNEPRAREPGTHLPEKTDRPSRKKRKRR